MIPTCFSLETFGWPNWTFIAGWFWSACPTVGSTEVERCVIVYSLRWFKQYGEFFCFSSVRFRSISCFFQSPPHFFLFQFLFGSFSHPADVAGSPLEMMRLHDLFSVPLYVYLWTEVTGQVLSCALNTWSITLQIKSSTVFASMIFKILALSLGLGSVPW